MGAPKESQIGVTAANELYWGSNQSVNKIAEKLELSKSALYDMIRPKPLDLSCPLCGRGVVYANRTACEKGFANCSECEWEGPENEANPFIAEQLVALPTYDDQGVVGLDEDPEKVSTSLPTRLDFNNPHYGSWGSSRRSCRVCVSHLDMAKVESTMAKDTLLR